MKIFSSDLVLYFNKKDTFAVDTFLFNKNSLSFGDIKPDITISGDDVVYSFKTFVYKAIDNGGYEQNYIDLELIIERLKSIKDLKYFSFKTDSTKIPDIFNQDNFTKRFEITVQEDVMAFNFYNLKNSLVFNEHNLLLLFGTTDNLIRFKDYFLKTKSEYPFVTQRQYNIADNQQLLYAHIKPNYITDEFIEELCDKIKIIDLKYVLPNMDQDYFGNYIASDTDDSMINFIYINNIIITIKEEK
jgi:hypothetical protein